MLHFLPAAVFFQTHPSLSGNPLVAPSSKSASKETELERDGPQRIGSPDGSARLFRSR
jgi:hypothetical protein